MCQPLLLQNGLIVTERSTYIGSVLIIDDLIADVGTVINYPSDSLFIDCTGMILLPGGIDPHVHLEYYQGPNKIRSADDFFTGSVAASLGGTTCLIDFCETTDGQHFESAIETRKREISKSVLPIGLHQTISAVDLDRMGGSLSLSEVETAIRKGISSFKVYTAYRGLYINDKQFTEIAVKMNREFSQQAIIIVHAEDNFVFESQVKYCRENGLVDPRYITQTRPGTGEANATLSICNIMSSLPKPSPLLTPLGLHFVHVSAIESARVIENYAHLNITGEVCVQHLSLTEDIYKSSNILERGMGVMAPVLRTEADNNYLFDQLKKEKQIHMTVTDHCPFTSKQRFGLKRLPDLIFDNDKKRLVSSAHEEKWHASTPTEMVPSPNTSTHPPFYEMPGGTAGIQLRVPIVINEARKRNFSWEQIGRIISTNAAKRFGMFSKYGSIEKGKKASILVWNPSIKCTVKVVGASCPEAAKPGDVVENIDVSLYEGREIEGWPWYVFSNGQKLVEEARFVGEPGMGGFLERYLHQ
ncbi:hypothetical protein RCL1_003367 [Eukaryota sp. TZLM3-RCL]